MLLQQVINGITVGATYALAAVGFSMVYGVLELANFANGAFYILGAYFTVTLLVNMNVSFAAAVPLCIIGTGILGSLMDKLFLGPIREKGGSRTSLMIATLGVGTCIINLIMVIADTILFHINKKHDKLKDSEITS